MNENPRKWVPEIMYEEYEEENLSGGIPFVQIPEDKEMPDILFMFGSQNTGEFEPDSEGEPQPIVEMELYQYACMQYLKQSLSPAIYDQVRVSLGLMPLEEATQEGMKISKSMLNNNEN
tara:strand:- start:1364 stop:1720 length:357 start_codon:yes stop_codon:yes gene_type:complete